jgi:hypothetical protein
MLLSGKFRTICGADVIEVVEVVPVGNLRGQGGRGGGRGRGRQPEDAGCECIIA